MSTGPSDRTFKRLVLAGLLGAHVYYGLVQGATFWVDGNSFVLIGEALRSWGALKSYYETTYPYWLGCHNGAGVALLWLGLSALPVVYQWPVLAFVQHAAAILSLYAVFIAVYRLWRSRWVALPFLLLALLPFYQSFHNALMGESITSSLVLLALAASMTLIGARRPHGGVWAVLLAAVFLLCQFRYYYALAAAGFGAVALYACGGIRSLRTLALAAVLGGGFILYPAYRWVATGVFVTPSLGVFEIMYVLWSNPHPKCADQVGRLAPFPPDLPVEDVLKKGIDEPGIWRLSAYWAEQGLSRRDMMKRAARISNVIRHDGLRVRLAALVHAANASGFTFAYRVASPEWEVERGVVGRTMTYQAIGYYRWLSWIGDGDEAQFGRLVETNVVPGTVTSWSRLTDLIKPYLTRVGAGWRDPFLIGQVYPDVWALLGWLSTLIVCLKAPRMGVLFAGILAVNVAVMFSVPLGNIRYAYVVIPVYAAASACAIGALRTGARVDSAQP